MNTAILLWDDVELLTFAGPAQVFSDAGEGGSFHVYTVAESPCLVVSREFLQITPEYTFDECPHPDVVVVPGGVLSYVTRREALLRWVREAARRAQVVLSVSSGARVLAAAGVLTAFHSAQRGALPSSPGDISLGDLTCGRIGLVKQGKVVVARDPAASIDAAILIVTRLCGDRAGREAARQIDRHMDDVGWDTCANTSSERTDRHNDG